MKRNVTEQVIEKLMEMGASRWTKGGHDRLYLNGAVSDLIGLKIECYKSGNISSATLNGEKISNSKAGKILYGFSGTYLDLSDCMLYKMYSDYQEELIAAIDAMCE